MVKVKCLKCLNICRYVKGLNREMLKDPFPFPYKALVRLIVKNDNKVYFNYADSSLQ